MTDAELVAWATQVADNMHREYAAREKALDECRRYASPLWEKGGTMPVAPANVQLVPQQDSYAAQCAWRAAQYLFANTVGLGQMFFRFDTDDELRRELGPESEDMKAVKSKTLGVIRELSDTNFFPVYAGALNDMAIAGRAVMYVEFNTKTKRLEFSSYQIGRDCYLSTNSRGRPDQFARKFVLTAKQAIERYGNKVSPRVLEQAETEQGAASESEYLWLVYPRAVYRHEILQKSETLPVVPQDKKAFGAILVDTSNKHLVEVSGYDVFPFPSCPWAESSRSVYSWSPTEMSLPDIKYLAKLKFQLGEALEKTVNPAMIIPYSWDGFDRGAGAFNYVEANGSVRDSYSIVEPPPQLPDIRDQQQRSMMNIRANYLLDAFETFDEMTKTMSATEARGRTGQSVRAIASIALAVHNDLLSPLLQRCLDLLLDNGVLAPLPEQVSRERVRVKYVSVLWSMILDAETNKIGDFFTRVVQLQEVRASFGPMFDAYFDIDAALAHLGDFYALPEDIIRTKKARLAKQAEIEEQVKASQKEEERLAMMEKMDPQRQSAPGSYAARRGF
ncbi:MAG: hypothetical protein E7037_02395 [Verrucomicrobia bacterium]|nr:hypothetical protein [Verrucomicrobiota bacterium]